MTAPVEAEDGTPSAGTPAMTHRQVLNAISGLLLAMMVAMLSGTIVANALPRIIADLDGKQSQYTWVMTATLLAAAASGPVWGKLADRTSKKLLVQIAITVSVTGSVMAGFSQSTGMLIGFRVLQGLGMGGLMALVQIVMGAIVSARERGRYMGYFGIVMTLATVGGPLLGGFIVDAPFLGWRWCFWVSVPVAVVALILLQKTLHLPVVRRDSAIDWRGVLLIPGGIATLLVWLTLAGDRFAWASWTSVALVATSALVIVAAVLVERRVPDPVIPPRLIRQRMVVLAIVIAVAMGMMIFGAAMFLGQYLQVARGYSPTASGILTMPMMMSLVLAITISGRVITRTGRWKRFLVAGTALMTVGLALLGTIDHTTPLALVTSYTAVAGAGAGLVAQNIVVATQNSVEYRDLGAGTATLTFFRTLGGAAGISALGAVLASHVAALVAADLPTSPDVMAGEAPLDLPALSPAVRHVVQQAYADGTALVFAISAVFAGLALVAALLIRETALRTTIGDARTEFDDGD